MNKYIIEDYYPQLPHDASVEQRIIRIILQILEVKEMCDRAHVELAQWTTVQVPIEKYSPIYSKLKKEICELI